MSKRTLIMVLILLALIGAGGYYLWQQQVSSARAATVANRQTATLTTGTLIASVSGAGNIYAPQQTNLSFQLSGVPITQVNVNVGDQVKAGDVLAQADDSTLQFALRTAQANLTSAQASLAKLQQPPLAADVQAAQAGVASAQSAYNVAVTKSKQGPDQPLATPGAKRAPGAAQFGIGTGPRAR